MIGRRIKAPGLSANSCGTGLRPAISAANGQLPESGDGGIDHQRQCRQGTGSATCSTRHWIRALLRAIMAKASSPRPPMVTAPIYIIIIIIRGAPGALMPQRPAPLWRLWR